MKKIVTVSAIAIAVLIGNEALSLCLLCIGGAYGVYKLFEAMAEHGI